MAKTGGIQPSQDRAGNTGGEIALAISSPLGFPSEYPRGSEKGCLVFVIGASSLTFRAPHNLFSFPIQHPTPPTSRPTLLSHLFAHMPCCVHYCAIVYTPHSQHTQLGWGVVEVYKYDTAFTCSQLILHLYWGTGIRLERYMHVKLIRIITGL